MPAAPEDYEVLDTVGQGSFGRVCRVRRREDGKELVWKEINYGNMKPVEKQRIADEVNILKDLRSPFIVRYYDHVHDKPARKFYIVMEHCPGGDLRTLIKTCRKERRYIEESFIWRVLAQLVVALKDCHRRNRPVLHRDIKPANVLLDADRNVKLADFGLAKELDNRCDFAATNVGTPYYMSPELVNHQHYDERCDIWAVGCLLYEAAALRPPFDAQSQLALAQKISVGKFSRIPDRYSDQLFNVIRAMLTRQPERRPRLEALEEIPTLAPYLREAKALSLEYDLQLRYAHRMRQVRQREEELRRREASARLREETLDRRQRDLEEREKALSKALSRLSTPPPPPAAGHGTPAADATHTTEDMSLLMSHSPNTTASTATSMDDSSSVLMGGSSSDYVPVTPTPPPTAPPAVRRPRQALCVRDVNVAPATPPAAIRPRAPQESVARSRLPCRTSTSTSTPASVTSSPSFARKYYTPPHTPTSCHPPARSPYAHLVKPPNRPSPFRRSPLTGYDA